MGRTFGTGSYAALHCTFGSGHGATITGGHAGHGLGSGQFGVGHLGLGHGGHSPILHGFEQVLIHGAHFGTDDFRTYLDISGCDGHSVFNIYLDISGKPGHGGTVDFRTYFVGSGTGQGCRGTALSIQSGPHPSNTFALPQPHFGLHSPQVLHVLLHLGLGLGLHPHCGLGFSHTLQGHIHFGLGLAHVWQGHLHLGFGL